MNGKKLDEIANNTTAGEKTDYLKDIALWGSMSAIYYVLTAGCILENNALYSAVSSGFGTAFACLSLHYAHKHKNMDVTSTNRKKFSDAKYTTLDEKINEGHFYVGKPSEMGEHIYEEK